MTLSFKTKINGKPTWFVEKIWKYLYDKGYYLSEYNSYYNELYPVKYLEQENVHYHKPKLHTIREDPSNRWKSGNNIHLVINNRTPQRFQFAPVIPCVNVQEIKIVHEGFIITVFIDGKDQHLSIIEKLAINDGFHSVGDFFAYFNKDFTGKIIHWTDLSY